MKIKNGPPTFLSSFGAVYRITAINQLIKAASKLTNCQLLHINLLQVNLSQIDMKGREWSVAKRPLGVTPTAAGTATTTGAENQQQPHYNNQWSVSTLNTLIVVIVVAR
uniref:Uncharacterized protein n=1 Tax=Bactrocera latifrons TaxID=174628 RepID=A0A0K8U652_BACLA